jgi:O-antigen/teichoic acid export membrane protein
MNPFLQSASWLGTAELFNRVMRLGTTVIVSRALSLEDYGLSAIVLVVAEVATVLSMRAGIGSKLVQSLALCVSVKGGITSVAITVLVINCISIPFFLRWVHRLDILSSHPTEVCS